MQFTHGLVSPVYRGPGRIPGISDQISRPDLYNVVVAGGCSHCFPDIGIGFAKGVREFLVQSAGVAFAVRDRVLNKGTRAFLRGLGGPVS
jgi:hypothetical protein